MKKVLTIILSFFTLLSFGQEISRSTNASSGGSIKNSEGYTIEWTLGAQFVQIAQNTHHLTEGFQQGKFQKEALIQEKEESIIPKDNNLDEHLEKEEQINYSVYPNPASNQLSLKSSQNFSKGATITLFDQLGKTISHQNIDEKSNEVSIKGIQDLAPSFYFIQIQSASQPLITLKFIKS